MEVCASRRTVDTFDHSVREANLRRERLARLVLNRLEMLTLQKSLASSKIIHHQQRHDRYQEKAVQIQVNLDRFIQTYDKKMNNIFPVSMTPFHFPIPTWRYVWQATSLAMEKNGLLAWSHGNGSTPENPTKGPHGCVCRCQSHRCHKKGGLVWVIYPYNGYKYNTYLSKKNGEGKGFPKFPSRCDTCIQQGHTKRSDLMVIRRQIMGLGRLQMDTLFYKLPIEVYRIIDKILYNCQVIDGLQEVN